ncbi:MAG: c-type cytochrome [Planctomycetia bacterium]|nr:c-type cytochrome [Planctomycetia bacterium]
MTASHERRSRWFAKAPLACALAALLSLALAGCEFPGQPDPADRPIPEDQQLDFGLLFQRNCAGCHGAEGKLGPAPPLNDELFLTIIPDADLLSLIRSGHKGTPMPAFAQANGGPLTEAQVSALATGLKQRWKPASPTSAMPTTSVLPPYRSPLAEAGITKKGDPVRGAQLFAKACAECHGADGKDVDLTIHDPDFLTLLSDQVLRRIVITGRSDLGMPSYAGTEGRSDDFQPLTSTDIDDVVALLAAWRRGPLSKSELK